jgi:hypothetical protein
MSFVITTCNPETVVQVSETRHSDIETKRVISEDLRKTIVVRGSQTHFVLGWVGLASTPFGHNTTDWLFKALGEMNARELKIEEIADHLGALATKRFAELSLGGWANIVLPRARAREGKIMYADLSCGPGQYRDGTRSTPLLVLDHIINTPALRDTVQTVFNDENAEFIKELESHIAKLPGIESLRYKPQLRNRVVGHDIIPRIQRIDVPTQDGSPVWRRTTTLEQMAQR